MGFPGVKGFEPLNLDTKNRRLTAWLYSNPYNWVITDSNRWQYPCKGHTLPTELSTLIAITCSRISSSWRIHSRKTSSLRSRVPSSQKFAREYPPHSMRRILFLKSLLEEALTEDRTRALTLTMGALYHWAIRAIFSPLEICKEFLKRPSSLHSSS